ncbi:hypothetical protein EV356DRAFT_99017 [Viridothelium virens]|uniref:RING-type E3 ubiquitin transferase n=1 Tax=Viridothelium virens TaxID=1048519 RepID=A0A6A6HN43_VIRVR|nr:hypothetical protein EV356DRAFT_99017 [Viridothelium virens]
MRLAAYAGFSTAAAAAVVLRAFHERPNFYSASVYLAQSNACLMVLTNLVLLCAFAFLFGLQRLLFGPLRPIEVEQLYEKAWFAVTETCLAMTMFREEVGGWFLVMFVSLLFGKVWGWISEGRVDFLEQQPPSHPRLFHARLSTSLLLSMTFNMLMFRYCLDTVYVASRLGMMVMFAFEFALLFISSVSTSIHYAITLAETLIVWRQTKERLMQRRAEVRASNEATQQNDSSEAGTTAEANAPTQSPEDITEDDIEVPGWDDKGRWLFFLDLTTDFFKLVVYSAFFFILMFFFGLPIHIMRDVYMTARSFTKRIIDFLKYRQATKDMNERYPDATSEELSRESTCIICREDMRSWQAENNPAVPGTEQANGIPRPPQSSDERLRPKKLPCGHILHLGCLRSWLERQQMCPTCRRSVLAPSPASQPGAPGNANQQQGQNPNPDQNQRQQPQNRIRRFNLGPLNLQFGVLADDQWQNVWRNLDPRQQQQQHQTPAQGQTGGQRSQNSNTRTPSVPIQTQLRSIEQQIMQEIRGLNLTQQQLSNVLALQGELARLRIAQSRLQTGSAVPAPEQAIVHQPYQIPQGYYNHTINQPSIWTAAQPQQQTALGAGHPDLPTGLALPQGWTALPLQRVGAPQPATNSTSTAVTNSSMGSGNMPGAVSLPNDAPQGPSSSNTTHHTSQAVPIPQQSTVSSPSQPSVPTAESQTENSGPSSNVVSTPSAETSTNRSPWTSSSWGFEDSASRSGSENAASGSSTRARPVTIEDVPDAEAGPSNTSST